PVYRSPAVFACGCFVDIYLRFFFFFFFNDTATTEIYTLSLHDALPILYARRSDGSWAHHFTARTPAGDQTTGEMIEFLDFRTQNQTILEPFTRSAVIFHLSEREARWERGRVTDCSAVPEVSGGSVDASRFRMLSYTVARVAKKEDGLTLD